MIRTTVRGGVGSRERRRLSVFFTASRRGCLPANSRFWRHVVSVSNEWGSEGSSSWRTKCHTVINSRFRGLRLCFVTEWGSEGSSWRTKCYTDEIYSNTQGPEPTGSRADRCGGTPVITRRPPENRRTPSGRQAQPRPSSPPPQALVWGRFAPPVSV